MSESKSTTPVAKVVERSSDIGEKEALEALTQMGSMIAGFAAQERKCKTRAVGAQWGAHDLCDRQYEAPCIAISYGIDRDYSFDVDVQKQTGCKVFSLDPTITHPAELAEHVYFLKWGAPLLTKGVATDGFRKAHEDWVSISPPALAHMLAPSQPVPILKMDCEGCEYALYSEVMAHDPTFFERVDQFAVEVHVSRMWMKSRKELVEYGRLLALLFRLSFRLEWQRLDHCTPSHEETGLLPELAELRYHDGKRGHCENFLFARSRT